MTELDSTSLYVMRRHSENGLGHIYGVAPEVVAKAAEYFGDQLRSVDAALLDGRRYICGDRFTSADILLTTCLEWALDYRVPVCASALQYLEGIRQRSAFQIAKTVNSPRREGEPLMRRIGATGILPQV